MKTPNDFDEAELKRADKILSGLKSCGGHWTRRREFIAAALRTAVAQSVEGAIEIVNNMDNRLYGDEAMTAKFQKHIIEALRKEL